jgi:hypothetical protein
MEDERASRFVRYGLIALYSIRFRLATISRNDARLIVDVILSMCFPVMAARRFVTLFPTNSLGGFSNSGAPVTVNGPCSVVCTSGSGWPARRWRKAL